MKHYDFFLSLILLIFSNFLMCQTSKEFNINEIDSTKNNYILSAIDIAAERKAIIIVEKNSENYKNINSYKFEKTLKLVVYKISLNIISADSIGPLIIEGKDLKMKSSEYDLYSAPEVPSYKTKRCGNKDLYKRRAATK